MGDKLGTQDFALKTNTCNALCGNKAPIEQDSSGNRGKIPNRLDILGPYRWLCTCQTTVLRPTPSLRVG